MIRFYFVNFIMSLFVIEIFTRKMDFRLEKSKEVLEEVCKCVLLHYTQNLLCTTNKLINTYCAHLKLDEEW